MAYPAVIDTVRTVTAEEAADHRAKLPAGLPGGGTPRHRTAGRQPPVRPCHSEACAPRFPGRRPVVCPARLPGPSARPVCESW